MQAPPTEFLSTSSSCDWCHYPPILCPHHASEFVPYVEPGPSLLYDELIDYIDFHVDAAETFRQVPASTELVAYEEPGPSSPYNEVIVGINIDDAAETFRQIAVSAELVPYEELGPSSLYNSEVIDGIHSADAAETSRQVVASEELAQCGKPRPSSLNDEVIDRLNSADVGGGESSTAETFRPIVASQELVAASNSRRTTGSGRFPCTVPMCTADFTAKHNLQSTSRSALQFRDH